MAELVAPLSVEQVVEFKRLSENSDESTSYLAGVLSLPDYLTDACSSIRLDYVTYTLTFAVEAGYGPTSTSSLLAVAHNLLEATAAGASYEDLEATFKTEMLKRTSPKPGFDSTLFSPDQVAAIARFFTRTFFRHWRLYSHCLRNAQEVAECSMQLLVETAVIPSFDDAVPEDEWTAAQAAQAEAAAQKAAQAQEAAQNEALQAQNAAAAAAADEEQRRRMEALAKKPATLEEAVEHLVTLRLEAEKKVLAAEYTAKEEVMLKKIIDLEAIVSTTPAKK